MMKKGGEIPQLVATNMTAQISGSSASAEDIRWINSSTVQGNYNGYVNVSNLKPEGYGEMRYLNEDVYKGQWVDGMRNGYGYFTIHTYFEYFGWWENGAQTGPGIQVFSNGDVYIGWFQDNARNGRGVYIKVESLLIHDGIWSMNKKHGKGKVLKGGICIYDGSFENNLCEGSGVRRQPTNAIDVSFFIAGNPIGDGIRWSPGMNSAYRLDGAEVKQEISIDEATRSSRELGLPIPTQEFVFDRGDSNIYTRALEQVSHIDPTMIENVHDLQMIRNNITQLFELLGFGSLQGHILDTGMSSDDHEQKRNSRSTPSYIRNVSFQHMDINVNNLEIDINFGNESTAESEISSLSSSLNSLSSVTMESIQRTENTENTEEVGTVYQGEMINNQREGPGTLLRSNGYAECHYFLNGEPKGAGVIWDNSRSKAWKTMDGNSQNEITLGEAIGIAFGLGLSIPDAS